MSFLIATKLSDLNLRLSFCFSFPFFPRLLFPLIFFFNVDVPLFYVLFIVISTLQPIHIYTYIHMIKLLPRPPYHPSSSLHLFFFVIIFLSFPPLPFFSSFHFFFFISFPFFFIFSLLFLLSFFLHI